MKAIVVEITRWLDEPDFPGWVECRLIDAEGQEHFFVEKVPVITTEPLGPDSAFPRPGAIACDAQAEWQDDQGRTLTRVDTTSPWGVESTAAISSFVVLTSQVVDSTP